MRSSLRQLAVFPVAIFGLSGCLSESSNYTASLSAPPTETVVACHGFNCRMRTRVAFTIGDVANLSSIMEKGAASPDAERAAVSKAVQYFEERAAKTIGVRDEGKSDITESGRRGQMDCIDESTNTRSLLVYLDSHKLLRHHKVLRNVSRGMLVDGRYPHSTAVLRDPAGQKWAVDSWYEPSGGAPDIMSLEAWLKRGVMGQR